MNINKPSRISDQIFIQKGLVDDDIRQSVISELEEACFSFERVIWMVKRVQFRPQQYLMDHQGQFLYDSVV